MPNYEILINDSPGTESWTSWQAIVLGEGIRRSGRTDLTRQRKQYSADTAEQCGKQLEDKIKDNYGDPVDVSPGVVTRHCVAQPP